MAQALTEEGRENPSTTEAANYLRMETGDDEEASPVAAHEGTPTCTLQPSFGDTACDLTWHCTGAVIC